MKNKIAKMLLSISCVLLLLMSVSMYGCKQHKPADDPTVVTDPTGEEAPVGGGENDDQEQKDPQPDKDTDQDPVVDDPDHDKNDTDQGGSNTEVTPPDNTQTEKELFPYTVAGYDLEIQKLAPYNGMFVEDGTNTTVENVAMLLVHNKSKLPVEYAEIVIDCGSEQLQFTISALPAGEKVVVQEKNAKPVPAEKATTITATVAQREDMALSKSQIEVTDNGNNTLTIRNLTDKAIPTVRVFYKYYMEEEDVFVGGIAFTVRITRLNAGASVTVQPSHYTSTTSRVVMVLTYDSEV